jgi:hypothetical protein
MRKIFLIAAASTVTLFAATAFAGSTPEMDPGSAGSALAVLFCGAVLILERRAK